MKGGGKIEGGLWRAKVKTLAAGDCIKCLNYAGTYGEPNGLWMGGEVLVVVWCEPSGLRDGFHHIRIFVESCPDESRTLAIRADDEVVMVARDADRGPKVPKQTKPKKPKKGQLSLF